MSGYVSAQDADRMWLRIAKNANSLRSRQTGGEACQSSRNLSATTAAGLESREPRRRRFGHESRAERNSICYAQPFAWRGIGQSNA